LKKIIEKHIMTGNTIVTDSSRIEGIWGELKVLFKKIYSTIRLNNFVYFLREIEYWRVIKNLNLENKLKNFSEVLECIGNGVGEKLISDDELISLD
jgi:hypothetical protein